MTSLDRPPLAGLAIDDFVRDFRSRNQDILTEQEQAAVDSAKVLVAGCGTVGGSAVEPLVRLGVADFVLADPDVYDVTNLNRQASLLADAGLPKPEVLAERVVAITPLAETTVLTEGITPDNVERALDGVTCVFEGVDASMDLWAKYLVHHHAAVRRLPVVSGVDFGGKPTLYVFDYRFDSRPFYGKGTEEDHREGRVIEAIRWIGARPIPADFSPVIVDRLKTGAPWPQTVYTSWGIGAMMTRLLVDLALHRRVPHIVAVDFHMIARRRRRRWLEELRWPVEIVRARRGRGRGAREGAVVTPSPERRAILSGRVPRRLLPIVDAIRRAPSDRNLQPWSLRFDGDDAVRLVADGAGDALLAQGIGCAVEAACSVAHVELDLAQEPIRAGAEVARLELGDVRPDYTRAAALLTARCTNRRPYTAEAPPSDLLARLERAAGERGVPVPAVTERGTLAALGELAGEAVRRGLAGEPARSELRTALRSPTPGPGVPADAMMPGDPRRALLRAWSLAPPLAGRVGIERVLAAHAEQLVRASGAVIVVDWGESPRDQLLAGRALMAVWLVATRAGWAAHPVSVPPPLGGAPQVLGTDGRPSGGGVTLIRIGRAGPVPRSPRRPLDQLAA